MSRTSSTDVRVLHAVRVMGYADVPRIADRLRLAADEVREHLLDAQARGWTASTSYAGDQGWSLTEAGRAHGERLLAAELDAVGARAAAEAVHEDLIATLGLTR